MSSALSVVRRTEQDGRSGIVVLTGEAGIGKTAVLEELIAQARTRGFASGAARPMNPGRYPRAHRFWWRCAPVRLL